MEFTDIDGIIQESLAGFLSSSLYFTITRGNLEPAIFRYYLIQDAYYLKAFRNLSSLADKTSNQEMKRLLKQNAQGLVEVSYLFANNFSRN